MVHRYIPEVPGSGRVKQEIFLTLVPVRFITNSGRPLTQLKYWSGTFLDKFRCAGPKNKYKFIVIAKIEFRPSAPSACNKMFSYLVVDVLVRNSTEYPVGESNLNVLCISTTSIDRKKCRDQL
jgi:hypothetical protein